SWIYIGTQGILQGTYETFAEAARQHFSSDLSGRLVVSGGLGGMGGAQPLAATMNGGAYLGFDIDPGAIERRLQSGYLDELAPSLDAAIDRAIACRDQKLNRSIGVVVNAADGLERLLARNVVP